jgi:hypothetical protein
MAARASANLLRGALAITEKQRDARLSTLRESLKSENAQTLAARAAMSNDNDSDGDDIDYSNYDIEASSGEGVRCSESTTNFTAHNPAFPHATNANTTASIVPFGHGGSLTTAQRMTVDWGRLMEDLACQRRLLREDELVRGNRE